MYVIKEDPVRRLLVLDTDFDLKKDDLALWHVEGVADVDIVNRYRARVEVGKLFTMAEVKAAVERALVICGEK